MNECASYSPKQTEDALATEVAKRVEAVVAEKLDEKRIEAIVEQVVRQTLARFQAKPPRPPGYVSVSEATAYTGLSRKFLTRAMKRGEFPYSNMSSEAGPTYIIALKSLDDWIAARQVKRAPDTTQRDAVVARYFPKRPAKRS